MAHQPLKGLKPKPIYKVGTRTDYVFKVTESKVKVAETFAGGGIRIDGFPSKTILLFNRGAETGLFSVIDVPPGHFPLTHSAPSRLPSFKRKKVLILFVTHNLDPYLK